MESPLTEKTLPLNEGAGSLLSLLAEKDSNLGDVLKDGTAVNCKL